MDLKKTGKRKNKIPFFLALETELEKAELAGVSDYRDGC